MDIQLHHLSDADKEAFVEGFADAAALDFPHFDAEVDSMREHPWSRPWENGPLTLVVQDKTMPSARNLGKQWFWVVREDMMMEAASEILPHHPVYAMPC